MTPAARQVHPPRKARSVPECASPLALFLLLVHTLTSTLPAAEPTPSTRSPRLPQPPGQPGFASAATCAECHQDEHASWRRSYHRSMTQTMDTNSVRADFNGVKLELHGERFTLRHLGNTYWAEVEDLTASPGTPVTRLPMELMTGSHHMQVFWVPAGAGNAQIGFPFTWLIPEARWVPRESTFIRDPHAPQQVETWNMTCIRCHVTGGQPRPRKDQGIFDTRVADLGIACEACHGPATEHVAFRRAHPDLPRTRATSTNAVAPTEPRDPIIQPSRLAPPRPSHVCAQCHSMKWFDASEGWVENGFRYRAGDDLEATTPVIRPARAHEQPWMRRALERMPRLLDEFFWSDGMIRVAGREFNGLLESACFQKGNLSCLSCHGLHDYENPSDQLKAGMNGNRACLPCHAAERYGPTHTHHAEGSSGSSCYNCHMPHTTYSLLGGIRQHQIDSPRVDNTVRTGRPNACNLCHLDRSLAWTRDRLAEWYQHPRTDLPEASGRVSAVAELLLSGDAGQRALAAWHLAWEPATRISGTDWQGPLLAHTLRDPYAAVRLVAHRSLRALPGFAGLAPAPLDTVEQQKRAADEVGARWRPAVAPGDDRARLRALLLRPDGTSDGTAVESLARRRDDRSMRLRE